MAGEWPSEISESLSPSARARHLAPARFRRNFSHSGRGTVSVGATRPMSRKSHSFLSRVLSLGLGLSAAGATLVGQDLTLSGGLLTPAHLNESTYSWQIDYRQEIRRHFAASAAWINEGHVSGHHRDGTAWQGWVDFPFWQDRIRLSLGAGAYF